MRDRAIRELYPEVVTINGEVEIYNQAGEIVQIDVVLIDQKIQEYTATYLSLQYARDRAAAYLPIQDQLDMQYWDLMNDTTLWKDYITNIKQTIPKS